MDDLTARELRTEEAVQFLETPRPTNATPAQLAAWHERSAAFCTVLIGEADGDDDVTDDLHADRDRHLLEARRFRREAR